MGEGEASTIPSPRLDGVRDQAPLGKFGVSLTGLRLHEVLPLDRSRDRSRACVKTNVHQSKHGRLSRQSARSLHIFLDEGTARTLGVMDVEK